MNVEFNETIDRLVRPTIHTRRRSYSTFQLCGCIGLELAVLLALGLVLFRGGSPWVMGAIIGAAIATFYALAFATKIVSGEEQLIYYHHEIAVMCVAALLLWALGQPPLAYLDATLLGIGAFLTCGRVGCLMVGCCHGRPSRWGVCYRAEHADGGFPRYYVGVRLFPIQAVESLWVFAAVVIGSLMILRGAAPGAALAWYIVVYDLGRFCFEFARGDTDRAYYAGFSEGQWISLALTWLVVGLGLAQALPFQRWHAVAAVGLALAMLIITLRRRRQGGNTYQLRLPGHVCEIAAALAPGDAAAQVHCTSQGIQISAGRVDDGVQRTYHYAVSRRQGTLSEAEARTIGKVIAGLAHLDSSIELVRGGQGVFHFVASTAFIPAALHSPH
jgi:prolipoprotein diacylglyceryltransferase